MMKNAPLNSEIAKVLADLGHTDTIVIADCGLPVPDGVRKIDLAVKLGTPGFKEVMEVVEHCMEVERVTVAAEMATHNTELLQGITGTYGDIHTISHEAFKTLTKEAKAVIRTGEATPYANIILHAGVIF
ncbi:D-ribose pyranase [Bacillus sp. P14.5]|uniref:D-ribose pyranase n=1 Tax=Bacillus sp. P14.5 TaxID=1983400 RepID=UPI000DE9CBC8|nr:D-ribose pyranase [Bacillus sp. P14.5]